MIRRRARPPPIHSMIDALLASTTEPMPSAKRVHQLTRMWQGLAAIERGQAPTIDDWRICSDAVNLTETLICELKVCQDSSGLLDHATAALASAGRRHRDQLPIRLNAADIQAVLEDYAELLEQLQARTVIQAHRLTEQRIREILAGRKRPTGVEVMDL